MRGPFANEIYSRHVKQQKKMDTTSTAPYKSANDYTLKEGQTININIGGKGSGSSSRPRPAENVGIESICKWMILLSLKRRMEDYSPFHDLRSCVTPTASIWTQSSIRNDNQHIRTTHSPSINILYSRISDV